MFADALYIKNDYQGESKQFENLWIAGVVATLLPTARRQGLLPMPRKRISPLGISVAGSPFDEKLFGQISEMLCRAFPGMPLDPGCEDVWGHIRRAVVCAEGP